MRGSVFQRGSSWTVLIDRGKHPLTGKRQRDWYSGFPSREAAEKERTRLLRELDTNQYVDPSNQSLEHYLLEEWLRVRKPKQRSTGRGHRGQLSIQTWATYRLYIEVYIVPIIGALPLQKVTADALDALYDQLEESGGKEGKGLSAKTVVNVHGVLHKAFEDAVKRGKILTNPAQAVDAPRAQRPAHKIWTVEQLRTFLEHVRQDRLYAAWLLFATTEMRRGEVAGLTREDLDLKAGKVRIHWTLGLVDNKATWKPRPKSEAGERVMSLDPATVDALRAHLAAQAQERLQLGPAWNSKATDWLGQSREDLVFAWPDGSMINPERFTAWFLNHSREAGLPRIRLHDYADLFVMPTEQRNMLVTGVSGTMRSA